MLFHREWLPSRGPLALSWNLAFHLPAHTRRRWAAGLNNNARSKRPDEQVRRSRPPHLPHWPPVRGTTARGYCLLRVVRRDSWLGGLPTFPSPGLAAGRPRHLGLFKPRAVEIDRWCVSAHLGKKFHVSRILVPHPCEFQQLRCDYHRAAYIRVADRRPTPGLLASDPTIPRSRGHSPIHQQDCRRVATGNLSSLQPANRGRARASPGSDHSFFRGVGHFSHAEIFRAALPSWKTVAQRMARRCGGFRFVLPAIAQTEFRPDCAVRHTPGSPVAVSQKGDMD